MDAAEKKKAIKRKNTPYVRFDQITTTDDESDYNISQEGDSLLGRDKPKKIEKPM